MYNNNDNNNNNYTTMLRNTIRCCNLVRIAARVAIHTPEIKLRHTASTLSCPVCLNGEAQPMPSSLTTRRSKSCFCQHLSALSLQHRIAPRSTGRTPHASTCGPCFYCGVSMGSQSEALAKTKVPEQTSCWHPTGFATALRRIPMESHCETRWMPVS